MVPLFVQPLLSKACLLCFEWCEFLSTILKVYTHELHNPLESWSHCYRIIRSSCQNKGGAGLKCQTRGHSHNCGVEMYWKRNLYCIWKVCTEGGGEGPKPQLIFRKRCRMCQNLRQKFEKNRSEIFMPTTLKCYNLTNIAWIAFGVVRIDFWAQFTPKIKLRFLILVLPPLCQKCQKRIQWQ